MFPYGPGTGLCDSCCRGTQGLSKRSTLHSQAMLDIDITLHNCFCLSDEPKLPSMCGDHNATSRLSVGGIVSEEQISDGEHMWTTIDGVFPRVPLEAGWPSDAATPPRVDQSTGLPTQYHWLGGHHPLARQRVALELPAGPGSIAVIDWNAARNTVMLFREP